MATPSPIPVVTIGSTGISKPTFTDVLNALVAGYQQIYGEDIYVEPDSMDGQWLGIVATAIDDANCGVVAVYNAFSPSTAQGVGLSSVVKINGLTRDVATYSTATCTLVGQVGITITNGVLEDDYQRLWSLPTSVTIPSAGQINVTITCQSAGAIPLLAGTQMDITTPVPGWQTATVLEDATQGAPVETDAQLRIRQSNSTMIPAESVTQALQGALGQISGVQYAVVYENDTDTTDATTGIPGNTISPVVSGGSLQTILTTIGTMKGPGVGTYGNTSGTYTDAAGVQKQVAFWTPVVVPISVQITLTSLTGFTTDTQSLIASTVAAWINALGVSQNVVRTRLFIPANLSGGQYSNTFEIVDISIAANGAAPSDKDIDLQFYEIANCQVSDVTFVVNT